MYEAKEPYQNVQPTLSTPNTVVCIKLIKLAECLPLTTLKFRFVSSFLNM